MDTGRRKFDAHHVWVLFKRHIWGPTGSIIIHILVIFALLNLITYTTRDTSNEVEVEIMELNNDKLDEIQKMLEKVDPQIRPDVQIDAPDMAQEAPPEAPSAQPEDTVDLASLDLAATDSPLVMKGLFSNRSAESRAGALGRFGGGGDTEDAVIRALRYLKASQLPDGSWPKVRVPMTGLALLTFLAHGETPNSREYGPTVEKAIRYLVSIQEQNGTFKGNGTEAYAHAIATYALSEAYGMCRIPSIRPVMEKAVAVIVEGQQSGGGWDYHYKKGARRDTSVSGWQIQALKAANIAGAEVPGLKEALTKASKDLRANWDAATGRFAYANEGGPPKPGSFGVTAAAVLALELMGYAESQEVKGALVAMKDLTCDWEKPGGHPFYTWYYVTQAKFHKGGADWSNWNKQFSRTLVKNQNEDGSWFHERGQDHEIRHGPILSTTLAALTLQVYYRLLPTYQEVKVEETSDVKSDDVTIKIF